MVRPALVFFMLLAFAVCCSQAQVETHGVPASVLSPTSPGVAHGTPSSVNSPVARNNGLFINPQRVHVFGNPKIRRNRRDRNFVPVPIFIPAYPIAGDYVNSPPDQAPPDQADTEDAAREQASSDEEALRQAYYRGARDALAQQRSDSRYGEHYLDSREKNPPPPPSAKDRDKDKDKDKSVPKESSPQEDVGTTEDSANSGPATVFIFKDGHRVETQNYAIQGQTLFDFSNNHLTKIKLADLDLDATKKANDDLGITVKLPPATP